MFYQLSIALCLTACGTGSSAPDATPCSLELDWGPLRNGDFQVYGDGDKAELTAGFQGFRYIKSTIRTTSPESPALGKIFFQVEVEGQETYSLGEVSEVPELEADNARYFDDVLVFFNDVPIAELIGRKVKVTTRLTLNNCVGTQTSEIVLADDDQCVEQEDGQIVCE